MRARGAWSGLHDSGPRPRGTSPGASGQPRLAGTRVSRSGAGITWDPAAAVPADAAAGIFIRRRSSEGIAWHPHAKPRPVQESRRRSERMFGYTRVSLTEAGRRVGVGR